MKPINVFIVMVVLILWLGCDKASVKESSTIVDVMSGQFAKVWIWKSDDTLDCHCYYEVIFKTGKMRHMRRDKYSSVL